MTDVPTPAARRVQFTQPWRQILSMLIVLGLVGFGTFMAFPQVAPVFLANPGLNGFIFAVFVIGVLSCFLQVAQLIRSVRFIEDFTAPDGPAQEQAAPQLLAPLAALLGAHGAGRQLSATASRSILDTVASRIEEDREITRYIVNTLIFLGLLGTFYGLATTVPALVETIRSLVPQEGEDGISLFSRLMSGLEEQLSGMGVAFASSLLGLAGSLVVGLLELFAGHGQNRFYRELEEWLSAITRVGLVSGDDGASDQEVMEAILVQMSEQMGALQQMFEQSDRARAQVDDRLAELASAMETLAGRLDQGENLEVLGKVAAGQELLIERLTRAEEEGGLDAESRMRLRSIDVQLLRLLEELSAGRQETMSELRGELSLMVRALQDPDGRG